jgi:hypothetical protein
MALQGDFLLLADIKEMQSCNQKTDYMGILVKGLDENRPVKLAVDNGYLYAADFSVLKRIELTGRLPGIIETFYIFSDKIFSDKIEMSYDDIPQFSVIDNKVFISDPNNPATQEICLSAFPTYGNKDKISSDAVAHEYIGDVAYINIKAFKAGTYESLKSITAEVQAKGLHKLAIDLRGNPGGDVCEAIKSAGLFLNQKTIAYLDLLNQPLASYASTESKHEYEIIILTMPSTASSAELFTAALQENGVAKTVGKTTYGKSSIQKVECDDSGRPFKKTIGRYLTPNQDDLGNSGIAPDYEVYDISGKDLQLAKALDLLRF